MESVKTTLVVKAGREKPIKNHHPWIFSGAIARVEGDPEPGDLVDVIDNRGHFLARAYFNPQSQISARILTWSPGEEIDEEFWRVRLGRSLAAREALRLEPETTAYRLVNAEADGLPGLIVDRYGEFLVIQCLTLGIDRRKQMIVELLDDLLDPMGIVERSDMPARRKEGLQPAVGAIWGQAPPAALTVQEHGLTFAVDVLQGHKTGFYLDQRENRRRVCRSKFVAGREILNVFAYTGAFAVYAAVNEAGPITNIDSSAAVLAQAERNVEANCSPRSADEYLAGDAFQVLRHYRDSRRQFDMVILDPPKFAHSRRDLERATRGYKDLNWLAFRLLRPGGMLATFSCSGRVSADLFQKIVFSAAIDAGRDAQIIEILSQAADHPILLTFPESAYLKGLLCRVW